MRSHGRVVLGLVVALPMAAYLGGFALSLTGDVPGPQKPIVLEERPGGTVGGDASDKVRESERAESPGRRDREKDRDHRDREKDRDDEDARVVSPAPTRVGGDDVDDIDDDSDDDAGDD
ncbi:MAG: hypothetical protein ACRCYQ_13300 [Nocardioides sp.]